ncbi:hypothetical protein [Streptomyces cinereoruber]|uniref:hypothetical protein n=1 Tax=Streptomyces cinereoruber TaxID=67260 RepID=UPI003C30253D
MRVTFAYPHTDAEGKTYQPDDTADLDDAAARQLIKDGHARPADGTKTRAHSKTTTVRGGRSDAKGSDS